MELPDNAERILLDYTWEFGGPISRSGYGYPVVSDDMRAVIAALRKALEWASAKDAEVLATHSDEQDDEQMTPTRAE